MNTKILTLIGISVFSFFSCSDTDKTPIPDTDDTPPVIEGGEEETSVNDSIKVPTIHYEINHALSGWYTDTWATSVTTDDGEIYAVYVKDDLVPHICKIDKKGEVTDIEVEANYQCDKDGHNEFIVGLDKQGYIHIMGNMHNNRWRYWRSVSSRNITDGFERDFDVEGPSGLETSRGECSYYYFRKSNSGELFMCCRASAELPRDGEGDRGVGLYKYNCDTKQWEARGAFGGSPECNRNVIFWESTLRYQMYKADIRFDKNDRMHFAVVAERQLSNGKIGSYVTYAYSDDYGLTWHNADGTEMTLPMGIDNSDILQTQESDGQVHEGKSNMKSEHAQLLLDKDNIPAVVYSTDNHTWYSYYKNGTWNKSILIFNTQLQRPETLYTDDYMYIIDSFTSDRVWKMSGYGQPAECINIGYSKTRWDHEAWRQGIVRFIRWNNTHWQVISLPCF